MQSSTDEKNGTFNVPEEEAPPPQFSEEWTRPTSDGQDRPVLTSSGHADFPSVGEMPIPNVSPMTAHFHLAVLKRFVALCKVVESKGTDADMKSKLLQQFLVCAEARYIRYLSLLDEFASGFNGKGGTFAQTMPLPPWDVAIIFHSHCLSPFRFYCDMKRRGSGAWENGIAFPLERLYHLIENGIWGDVESQHLWGNAGAYQLWESDPTIGNSELRLQDVEMSCPWCSHSQIIPLAQFTAIHTGKSASWKCTSCGIQFNADTLSAKFFKDDLTDFLKIHHSPWTVKGAITGMHDDNAEEDARANLGFALETSLHRDPHTPATPPHLALYIGSTPIPNWKDIITSFKKTTAELKGARLLRALTRGNLFTSMEYAYMGILWHDISIDLVAAALRQREFATKITSAELASLDTPLAIFKATTRYHKFLLLMRRKKEGKRIPLVPTLDIDLCWHTHQLSTGEYRKWCIEHLGLAINHDDTVGKESLDNGLRETSAAWYDAYRETYSTENVSESKVKGLFSGNGIFSRKKSTAGKDVPQPKSEGEETLKPYMSMYAYWLTYPQGWNYPAACASGKAGKGGWAASIDFENVMSANDEGPGKCAGCTGGGCSYGGDNYNV